MAPPKSTKKKGSNLAKKYYNKNKKNKRIGSADNKLATDIKKIVDANRSRNFICNVCGKTWMFKSHLVKHQETHQKTRTRPFQCDICDKQFDRPSRLRIHQRVHTNDRDWKCPDCPKDYKSKPALKDHMKVKHPNRISLAGSRRIFKDYHLFAEVEESNGKKLQCRKCRLVITATQDALQGHIRRGHVEDPDLVFAETNDGKIRTRRYRTSDHFFGKTRMSNGLWVVILKPWHDEKTAIFKGIAVSVTSFNDVVFAAEENWRRICQPPPKGIRNCGICSCRRFRARGWKCVPSRTKIVPIAPSHGFDCAANMKWVVRGMVKEKCLDTFHPLESFSYYEQSELKKIRHEVKKIVDEMSSGVEDWEFIDEDEQDLDESLETINNNQNMPIEDSAENHEHHADPNSTNEQNLQEQLRYLENKNQALEDENAQLRAQLKISLNENKLMNLKLQGKLEEGADDNEPPPPKVRKLQSGTPGLLKSDGGGRRRKTLGIINVNGPSLRSSRNLKNEILLL